MVRRPARRSVCNGPIIINIDDDDDDDDTVGEDEDDDVVDDDVAVVKLLLLLAVVEATKELTRLKGQGAANNISNIHGVNTRLNHHPLATKLISGRQLLPPPPEPTRARLPPTPPCAATNNASLLSRSMSARARRYGRWLRVCRRSPPVRALSAYLQQQCRQHRQQRIQKYGRKGVD